MKNKNTFPHTTNFLKISVQSITLAQTLKPLPDSFYIKALTYNFITALSLR